MAVVAAGMLKADPIIPAPTKVITAIFHHLSLVSALLFQMESTRKPLQGLVLQYSNMIFRDVQGNLAAQRKLPITAQVGYLQFQPTQGNTVLNKRPLNSTWLTTAGPSWALGCTTSGLITKVTFWPLLQANLGLGGCRVSPNSVSTASLSFSHP